MSFPEKQCVKSFYLCCPSLLILLQPPSYYNNTSDQNAIASASSSSTPLQPTFKSKPTNYLHLFNDNSSIKGEYVIDPGMTIPTSLLPPLSSEESEADRKNLSLHSTHGSVNADIWLLGARAAQPSDSKKSTKRTTLDVGSDNGSVTARVVCRLFDCDSSPLIRMLAHYSRG